MLRLLLDEQISPHVAEGLRRRTRRMTIRYLAEWEDGRFLGLPDELLLEEAARQNLVFVTYDRRTIPPLLKEWAEQGRNHAGVIFVDQKTIPSSDFGNLIRALISIGNTAGEWNW